MENEIKVGEWIRTKDGVIAKVTYVDGLMIDTDNIVFDLDNLSMMEIPVEYIEEYIVKHSHNILDLLEVGDMVHTKDVLNEDWYWMFDEEMIKATRETIEQGIDLVEILTKEMMESMSYKVERKEQ